MHALGYISDEEYQSALLEPDNASLHGAQLGFAAHYAAEMARQEMVQALRRGGLHQRLPRLHNHQQ